MTEKSKPNDNSFWGGVACCAIAALAIWWFGIREEKPKPSPPIPSSLLPPEYSSPPAYPSEDPFARYHQRETERRLQELENDKLWNKHR